MSNIPRQRQLPIHRASQLWIYGLLMVFAVLISAHASIAQEAAQLAERLRALEIAHQATQINLDTLWIGLASILVFSMQAGFVMLEVGLGRHPQSSHSFAKRLIVLGVVTLVFWAIGFGLMFGSGSDWVGETGWFLISPGENSPTTGDDYTGIFTALNGISIPLVAKFCFQLTLAGLTAAIISSAIADRMQFTAFILFCALLVGIPYAIIGHWVWGNGWLERLGFWDFSGATVIHSVGGWIGLVGTLLLGPRLGKYAKVAPSVWQQLPDQSRTYVWPWSTRTHYQLNSVAASNLGLATFGCLLVWVGWLGLNAGSLWSANGAAITHIFVNTIMAGAMGGLGATISSSLYFTRPPTNRHC